MLMIYLEFKIRGLQIFDL